MSAWPSVLGEGANMFEFARFDPDATPELRVATWSNVFESGGSVSVDVWHDGKRAHSRLAQIQVERDGSVLRERKHLESLVADWNEDAAGNWRRLITDCRERVLAYYERNAAESAEKAERAKAGDFS